VETHRGIQSMYHLATIESLIGSAWASIGCLAIGYIAGHLVSITRIASWIPGKER
jgi:ABC-type cobalt transport system substrate-binding protein